MVKDLELPATIGSTLNMTSVFYVDKGKVQEKELKLQVYMSAAGAQPILFGETGISISNYYGKRKEKMIVNLS